MPIQNEIEQLKGKRADKKSRLDQLETRASALLSQIRRDLGGGYVESLDDVDVAQAREGVHQLADVKKEAEKLEEQIEEINEVLDT